MSERIKKIEYLKKFAEIFNDWIDATGLNKGEVETDFEEVEDKDLDQMVAVITSLVAKLRTL